MSKLKDHYGEAMLNEYTKAVLEIPITKLSRLIASKWFSTLEQLAEKSGVPFYSVQKALHGENISPRYEAKLRAFLENL